MNKRQVLLAAAIASLALVNVANANEVTSISDVVVVSQVKEVAASCKELANDCYSKTGVMTCGAWLE